MGASKLNLVRPLRSPHLAPVQRSFWRARFGLLALLAGLTATGTFPPDANAEPPSTILPEQIGASPDTPAFGFLWRRAPRVTLAASIPLAGAPPSATLGFRLIPFVELHNNPGSTTPVPNENWRGRVSVEGWKVWRTGSSPEETPWLRISASLDHESDHGTIRFDSPPPQFAFHTLNDLALRMEASALEIGPIITSIRLDSRLYYFSCTQPGVDCIAHLGSTSYGGELDFTSQLRLKEGWSAFWSASLSWILAHQELLQELRLVSHLGLWKRGPSGMWQFFVLGFVGNDVGVNRDVSYQQIGIGIRWVP